MANPATALKAPQTRRIPRVCLLLLSVWWGCVAHAQVEEWVPGTLQTIFLQSDPHQTVIKLLRQAKYAEALERVEGFARANPTDPQMRFWQAYLRERLGRKDEAEAIYEQMTREFPELAEPYNNLAVLLASRGALGPARKWLEAALRANPNYRVAHENLGDVLVRQAREAYGRAAQGGPKNEALERKLERLQRLTQEMTP